jgi:hypothetical protein
VWNAAHGNAVLSAMHFAKSLVAREYAQRLGAQGRNAFDEGAVRTGLGAHAANLLLGPGQLLGFANFWVRKRILAERKIPGVST